MSTIRTPRPSSGPSSGAQPAAAPLRADPTNLAIFGATGDLSNRKLLPALYNLAHDGALPERFNLVGISRSEMTDEEFRKLATEAVRKYSRRTPDDAVLTRLFENARYVPGTFDQPDLYAGLEQAMQAFDEDAHQRLNRCFYLSTAPTFFPVIVGNLGEQGLNRLEGAEVRVIIEKPFGTTLEEAVELNRQVLSVFDEHQVFRIDHYLGKETVQNIMAFRFANGMFEPLWNRNYIDNIQITAAEDLGIGTRAGYYDSAGALRDLIQNHMLQLLCHVAMEPPVNFTADEVRNEKVKVLHAIPEPADADIPGMAVRASVRPRRRRAAWRCRATRRRRASRSTRAPRPTPRCAWRSATGAGRACPSTCAPASASPARSPRSRSRYGRSHTWDSAGGLARGAARTCW